MNSCYCICLPLHCWVCCQCKSVEDVRHARFHVMSLSRFAFAFAPEPKNCPLAVFLYVSGVHILDGTSLHLHVCRLAAGICCEGQSLCLWRELIRCADVCSIFFLAYSVNTIRAFYFSRLLFHYTPCASPAHPPSTPARLSLCLPLPSRSLSPRLGPVQI